MPSRKINLRIKDVPYLKVNYWKINQLRRSKMIKDKLRIQTLCTYTQENPKNTMRVLDNLLLIEPKTYYSGVTKIPASTIDDLLLMKDINHIVLICEDSTFTLKIQETNTLNSFTLEEIRQFNYSSNKPIDVFLQNPTGKDVSIKVVYSNDI